MRPSTARVLSVLMREGEKEGGRDRQAGIHIGRPEKKACL